MRPVGRRPTVSFGAGRQLLLLDREDLARFDFDVANQAGAAADVFELGVIAAGRNSGDAQALVGIDGAVLVVLALVGPPVGRAGRRQIELGNRMAGAGVETRRPAPAPRRRWQGGK